MIADVLSGTDIEVIGVSSYIILIKEDEKM